MENCLVEIKKRTEWSSLGRNSESNKNRVSNRGGLNVTTCWTRREWMIHKCGTEMHGPRHSTKLPWEGYKSGPYVQQKVGRGARREKRRRTTKKSHR